jgi:hypothetical protein
MPTYAALSQKPRRFLAMTGYTVEEFDALVPTFRAAFGQQMSTHTLERKERTRRRYSSYRNSPLPTLEDKLLFILVYLKQATTQEVHATLFGMTQPKANQWIHLLLPLLQTALESLGELPVRDAEELNLADEDQALFFHDGTERPISRPKDEEAQRLYYSGKKRQHTVKNNVVADASCKIRFLTDTCEGKKHDKRLTDEAGYSFPEGSTVFQDTGFQGFCPEGILVMQPKKKPRGGELTAEEKQQNQRISSVRIRVEHAIGGVKRYRIVKSKLRNWKQGFRDRVMLICCALHNFRLNFRPWNYDVLVTKPG